MNKKELRVWGMCYATLILLTMSWACREQPASHPPAFTPPSTPSDLDPYPDPPFEKVWEVRGEWVTFSSPRVVDLNLDGVLDVVIGHGMEATGGSVTAHDGRTGGLLWELGPLDETVIPLDEIVGSATFIDLTDDETPDVVIGGRESTLLAIDGKTGDVVWRFYPYGGGRNDGWYNFYSSQVLDDQNQDGVADLLISNGGDSSIEAFAPRPVGHLMMISGATGEILHAAAMPDGGETYMSPLIYRGTNADEPWVLFGTGGETHAGALWRIALSELRSNSLSNAEQLTIPLTHKGVMAPPALADVTADGIVDIFISTFDGRLLAIDGDTANPLWELYVPNSESYATPAIGHFDLDSIPDVFAVFHEGTWPQLESLKGVALSGATGEIIYEMDVEAGGLSSPITFELTGDALDEVVWMTSISRYFPNERLYLPLSTVHVVQFSPTGVESFDIAGSVVATPTIVDLEQDGTAELVLCTNAPTWEWTLTALALESSVQDRPSWGAYMGTDYNGVFE